MMMTTPLSNTRTPRDPHNLWPLWYFLFGLMFTLFLIWLKNGGALVGG